MGIYLVSTTVFLAVLLALVTVLLVLEHFIAPQGERSLNINNEPARGLKVKTGQSLLNALNQNQIYLPSGCGGGGTCGLCKCKILAGGGELLPTELPHLSRAEKLGRVRLACQVKVRENMDLEIAADIFNVKKYDAEVLASRSVTPFIKELTVKTITLEPLHFKAGSYMQIDIPEYRLRFADCDIPAPYRELWAKASLLELSAVNAQPTTRAYSTANRPGEPNLMFTIKVELPPRDTDFPPGVGSSYLFGLKPGAKLVLSGPFGDFFVKETPREMCFIGGGAGMAPMRAHILDQLKNKHTQRKITFWYGARSRMEIFYDDEFKALAGAFPNFEYTVALSEPFADDNWDGPTGFIHEVAYELYLKRHKQPDEIEYYVCGPPLMLKATLNMLDGLGVDPAMIAYDDFGQNA